MKYKHLTFEVHNNIAVATLDRPDALNALTDEMFESLDNAYAEVNTRNDIRVLIITGAGRGFCSGIDLKIKFLGTEVRQKPNLRPQDQWIAKVQAVTKPTIAAVNGPAVGGGMALALGCDIRIASDRARISTRFSQIGMPVLDGAASLLIRTVGFPKALELLYTAEMLDAEMALKLGMVNQVVPENQFWKSTMALAKKIASGPPLALQLTKYVTYQSLHKSFQDHLGNANYASMLNSVLANHDIEEGANAFIEKRDPKFRGILPDAGK